jgi:hypothetical protein
MGVLATVGIVIGLLVIALMALAPTLVDLNERHPLPDRDEPARSLDLGDSPPVSHESPTRAASRRFLSVPRGTVFS